MISSPFFDGERYKGDVVVTILAAVDGVDDKDFTDIDRIGFNLEGDR